VHGQSDSSDANKSVNDGDDSADNTDDAACAISCPAHEVSYVPDFPARSTHSVMEEGVEAQAQCSS